MKRLIPALSATWLIVLFAFALRMAYFSRDLSPFPGSSLYGGETGAVAAAIASGRGFSSPLPKISTGPTAWLTPIYPYLLAGTFRLFGIYTYKSMVWIRLLNIIFSALTCWPIFVAGRIAFGKGVGAASARSTAV